MRRRNPYEVLGVEVDASPSEVHSAWRRLCAIYHPDRYMDASADVRAEAARRMAEVNEGYSTVIYLRVHGRPTVTADPVTVVPGSTPTNHAGNGARAAGAPEASRPRSPISRAAWHSAVVLALVLGCVAMLVSLRDDGGRAESAAPASKPVPSEERDVVADARGVAASPLEAPATTCPPDGEVRWITDALEVREITPSVGSVPAAFEVSASGRIVNRTESSVIVKPFVEIYDEQDNKGALSSSVYFFDERGNSSTTPPTLQPGDSTAWELRAAVRIQAQAGAASGPPVRAEPVANGLTAWNEGTCSFSAFTDSAQS